MRNDDDPLTNLTAGWTCKKRNGETAPFDAMKILEAVMGGFSDTPAEARPTNPHATARSIATTVVAILTINETTCPTVEHIQRLVIRELWVRNLFATAEAYQNYREERRKVRDRETAPAFTRRREVKPYEYPEVIKFIDAIAQSYWTVKHWNFQSDVQDFKTNLTDPQRRIVRNALLAISQVEIEVKLFWVKLGERFRKPEFAFVGITFGESEVRHCISYSHLLEVLQLNDEFAVVTQVPAIQARIDYLSAALKTSTEASDKDYLLTLAMFSLFVENVSLFGQFYVVQAFHKHMSVLKDVDNVIQATRKEEDLHARFGIELINMVRTQRPEWFDADFYAKLSESCQAAYAAEARIVDWIFGDYEPDFLSKKSVLALIESRFNEGLVAIGGKPLFSVSSDDLRPAKWFVEEQYADVSTDFFHKRPVTYARGTQSVTVSDLFE